MTHIDIKKNQIDHAFASLGLTECVLLDNKAIYECTQMTVADIFIFKPTKMQNLVF